MDSDALLPSHHWSRSRGRCECPTFVSGLCQDEDRVYLFHVLTKRDDFAILVLRRAASVSSRRRAPSEGK